MRSLVMCFVMVVGLVSNVFAQGSIPARNGHGAWTSYAQAKAEVETKNIHFYYGSSNRNACNTMRNNVYSLKNSSISFQASSLNYILTYYLDNTSYGTRYTAIQGNISSNSSFTSQNNGYSDAQLLEIDAECAYEMAVSDGTGSQANLELFEEAFMGYNAAEAAYASNLTAWTTLHGIWENINNDAVYLLAELIILFGEMGP